MHSLVTGTGREVLSHRFTTTDCSKEDLIAAVKQWLNQHPGHNKTVPEQLLSDQGHRIIYTPPHSPDVQPIEKLWALVKSQVARRATLHRSITDTRVQAEEAFEYVTPEQFNNIVRHCHDWVDSWLSTAEAGDLQQCGTLAGVVKALPLLNLARDNPSTPSTDGARVHNSGPAPSSAPAAGSSRYSFRARAQ